MAPAAEPLPPGLVEGLASPGAYPDDPGAADGPEHVQTHISHVFLTGERVYKLRKAVELSFLHFATRDQRNRDCLREVALNRRLAPDVYLGVAPVLRGPRGWEVGPVGEELAAADGARVPEHCVVMRRLPAGCDALSLLGRRALTEAHLAAVARVLARFHVAHGLGRPAPFAPAEWLERVAAPARANFLALREAGLTQVPEPVVRELEARSEARLAALAGALERRRAEGRAVDGHGDVHLQHAWFEGGPEAPLLIDCIEFDDDLRRIDAASEVAFLAMDLAYRERPDLAATFLRHYAFETDDYGLFDVVDFYVAYRAGVRAKVAGLAAADPAIAGDQRRRAEGSAARHVALARDALREPTPGPLVLLCGTVGSGKSTLARDLAAATGGVVVGSDATRKRLAGLEPGTRAAAPAGGGIYGEAMGERVYAALLERAAPVIGSGRVAILDATYGRRARREAARAWAAERGAEAWLVEARCPEDVARARLRERAREGRDPSDAGPGLLAASLAGYEPPVEWPAARCRHVDTAAPERVRTVADVAREVAPGVVPPQEAQEESGST